MKILFVPIFILFIFGNLISQITWSKLQITGKGENDRLKEIVFDKNDVIYLSVESSTIYKSTDLGNTWTNVFKSDYNGCISLLINEDNNLLVFGPTNGFYLSHDDGNSFDLYYCQLSGLNVNKIIKITSNLYYLLGNSANRNHTCSQYFTSYGFSSNSIYRSTDKGLFWSDVLDINNYYDNNYYDDILTAPDGLNYLISYQWQYYYQSKDSGLTWQQGDHQQQINFPFATDDYGNVYSITRYELSNYSFNSLIIYSANNSKWQNYVQLDSIYADRIIVANNGDLIISSFDSGIYYSKKLTGKYSKVNYGIDNYHNLKLYKDRHGYIYALNDSGLFRTDEQLLNVKEFQYQIKNNLIISPNPVTQSAKLNYSLNQPGKINISLFNELGNEITTLSSGYQETGAHTIDFSPSAYYLSTGVYFIRLVAGGEVETEKVVILN